MSKNNVYISYSIPNEHYAKEVAEFLKYKGTNPVYWKMGTPYEKEYLSKSDAVVFILGCYYWSKDLSDLTRGVRKELDTALQLHLPIYIAYMRKDGALQVYKAVVEDDEIHGIQNVYFESSKSSRYCPDDCKDSKIISKRRHR